MKADLKIEDDAKDEKALSEEDAESLAKWAKEKLGDKVEAILNKYQNTGTISVKHKRKNNFKVNRIEMN